MNDNLKATIDRARAAGMTGLVCGVCDGDGARDLQIHCEHGGPDETRTGPCPACDGTGYPSAAEVLMWAAVNRSGVRECLDVRYCSVSVRDCASRYHDGEPESIATAALGLTLDAMGVT